MIANFFKKTKPIHAIFIGCLFVFFYILSIFVVEKPEFSFFLVLKKLGYSFLFLILFFLIRFINRKNNLSGQDSYVLLILALLFGMFPKTMLVNKVFIAHFIILFSFRRTYSIQSLKNVKQKNFDSGFWIGIASLFYMWSALFLLLPLIATYLHKKLEIRNSLILILGFITPLFLVYTYYLMTDNTVFFFNLLVFEYHFSFINFSSPSTIVPMIFIGVITLVSLIVTKLRVNTLQNDLKPSWNLLLSHLLISVFIIFISPDKNGSEFVFAFLPMAIFSANLLQLVTHKKLREVIVYSMLLVAMSAYIL